MIIQYILDDIIKITNIDIKQLYELLFEMQIKNEIIMFTWKLLCKNNIIKYIRG